MAPTWIHQVLTAAEDDHRSVIDLTRELVRIPSRGGIDPYDPVLDRLGTWLTDRGLSPAVLTDDAGAAALGFAARQPHRISRLALLNSRAHRTFPAARWLMFAATAAVARTPLLDGLLEHTSLAAAHRLLARRYIRVGCFDRDLLDRDLAWLDTPHGRRWFGLFYRHYRLRTRKHMLADLATLTCPAAVIWGDRDPYCPPRIARQLADRIPHATLDWQHGADHFVAEERPADVLAAIRGLLDRPITQPTGKGS